MAVSASKMSAMPMTRACTDICSRVRPLRVALAVHALVVAAGVLRHVPQVLRPGQRLQHLDGGDDVVVDDLALLLRSACRRGW